MHTNSKLAKSVRLALMFGATATAMSGASVAIAQDDTSFERTERIQVTGSRIQRTDMEGALPVTVIDRASIDMTGETSVADVLRNTTFNSAGSFRPQSGSSAQGTSSVDMRGLGASRTLILIDGRRLTMSPSTGSSQDLNSIPMAIVERIEVLTDGASAIYGSDAIGGVINVITRRDFNGVEVNLGYGEVSLPSDGGDRETGSVVFGSASNTTSLIGGVSWNRRAIIYDDAYSWNDQFAAAGSLYGNNYAAATNPDNFWGFKLDSEGDFALDSQGNRIPNAPPIMGVPGSCGSEDFFESTARGPGGEDVYRCQYNTRRISASEASTGNESVFVKVRHDINPDWAFYANANYATTSSFGRFAPALDVNSGYQPSLLTPADSYNNPTNPNAWFYDPNNPNAVAYDADLVGPNVDAQLYHRFHNLGPRDTNVDNDTLDFLAGVEGYIGDTTVDFGVRRVRNRSVEIGQNYVGVENAWNRVNSFNPGYGPDGTFNPDLYREGYDISNPAGNPEDVIDAIRATTSRISSFEIDEVFGSAAFDVFELPAGLVQAAVGVEYRQERYRDSYDGQSEAGLIGGTAGNSAGGDRNVTAAYAEFVVPVTYDFELTFAGRFDDYNDYGSDFSPKVGFEYKPVDRLLIRGSYGQGFRAPSLDILSMETSYSADSVRDPVTCEVLNGDPTMPCQVDAYRLSNADLDSEESTQMAFGVVYQATDWLNFSVDYFDIEIDNRIAFIGSTELLQREEAGDPVPEGLGVEREVAGDPATRIIQINTGYDNDGTLETNGMDFNIQSNFDFADMGRLTQNLQWSHVFEYRQDGGRNRIGDPSRPQNRVSLSNVYTYANFDFAWNINMVGNVAYEVSDGVQEGHVGSWTTHDLQVSYNTPWEGRITLGMQNAFEKTPNLTGFGGNDYNFNLYHAYGRHTYVRYTQSF